MPPVVRFFRSWYLRRMSAFDRATTSPIAPTVLRRFPDVRDECVTLVPCASWEASWTTARRRLATAAVDAFTINTSPLTMPRSWALPMSPDSPLLLRVTYGDLIQWAMVRGDLERAQRRATEILRAIRRMDDQVAARRDGAAGRHNNV